MTITLEQLREALALKEQIAALEERLEAVLSGNAGLEGRKGRGSGRRAQVKAMEAQEAIEQAESFIRPGRVSKSRPLKKRGAQTAEARQRISDAAKARWAKKREEKAKQSKK